ncbi:MAG: DUF4430 domain-containing protein [Clostridiales bacterium]|nr:DUF4430 domain-containing protein [Clostridiales bacterium]
MKKFLSAIIIISVLLLLCACGFKDFNNTGYQSTTPVLTSSEEKSKQNSDLDIDIMDMTFSPTKPWEETSEAESSAIEESSKATVKTEPSTAEKSGNKKPQTTSYPSGPETTVAKKPKFVNKALTTYKAVWTTVPHIYIPGEGSQDVTSPVYTTAVTPSVNKCSVEINCESILNNRSSFNSEKEQYLPKNGVVFKRSNIKANRGDTAFDVIKKVCADNTCSENCRYCQSGIHLEYSVINGKTVITGVHHISEKDCGENSAWLFTVNNQHISDGIASYHVKDGDVIKLVYICEG